MGTSVSTSARGTSSLSQPLLDHPTMSWQAYVDDHLVATGQVKHAVLAGHDGSVWAKSAAFPGTANEGKNIATNFNSPGTFQAGGLHLGGKKYMFLSNNDKVLRFKKSQSYIIALYEEPTVAEQCAQVTEKLGEYLIS